MPNPFPGMNPYLEDPVHWRTVHHGLIHGFFIELNRILPPGFVTFVEDRVYVADWNQSYYPDAFIVETPLRSPEDFSAVALLERPAVATTFDVPLRITADETTVHEPYLEIRAVGDNELIAVVEFLSPTNKDKGPGQKEYARKQKDVLHGFVHLLEIDLLRAGTHAIAPPEKRLRQRTGRFDYVVSLHPAGARGVFDVWATTVRDRLPRIRLPLTAETGAVSIDLQMILDRAYDEGGYYRFLNYRDEPTTPLVKADAAWADGLLKNAGLR